MKVWVTRDNNRAGFVCLWDSEPSMNSGGMYAIGEDEAAIMFNGEAEFNAEIFKRKWFGFTPRKGSCKQYELTLTEIE